MASNRDPNQLIKGFEALVSYPNHHEALGLLKKIALSVKPIMKNHGWHVGLLAEFFPDSPNLLGLNVNHGMKICIRLRAAEDKNRFYPFDDLIGTMLHELTHIVRGPHDAEFYSMLDKLNTEYDSLIKDQERFFGQGHRLGELVSHNVPTAMSRIKALEAAEKRRMKDQIMMEAGRRLGGVVNPGLSLREKAYMAAERRRKDRIWCGSGETTDKGSRTGSSASRVITKFSAANSSSSSRDRIPENKIPGISDWSEWTCSRCTFVNKFLVLQCEVCYAEHPNQQKIVDGNLYNGNFISTQSINLPAEYIPQSLGWSCPRCTLENDSDVILCLGCDYLREEMIS